MSSPFQTGKKAVDLAAPAARVSRIRRDPPPPPPKTVTAAEIKERDAQDIFIGLVIVALAMLVIMLGIAKVTGWSPSQYTIRIEDHE